MENSKIKLAKQSCEEQPSDLKHLEQTDKQSSLNGTTDDKYQALVKKTADLEKESKKMTATLKMQEKRYESLLREKENLQKEHNKSVLMRTKLEQVCREQQKLLKSVQNESVKHKETQAKFQHSINEISSTLTKNNEENLKLKEDNIEMTKKLKYLAEQYQIREKQLEKINEQVQLESQLHEAKLAKSQMEAAMEKEILLKEKQVALDELLNCKKNIQEIQKREEMLKEQLGLYTSKYDDFQNSLQKSNDVFASYKTELEKMVKKTKKLEKESSEWKRKCENSTSTILDLATEKQVKDEYIAKTAKQMQQLQKLLRTLQAERTTLHKILKENSIEIPPMPVLPPEPEPVSMPPISKQPDKIDTMAKNCAELKQSLALLQDQMSALTTKGSPSDQTVTESSSKSKNKKNKSKNKSSVKDRSMTEGHNNLSAPNKCEILSQELKTSEEHLKMCSEECVLDDAGGKSVNTVSSISIEPLNGSTKFDTSEKSEENRQVQSLPADAGESNISAEISTKEEFLHQMDLKETTDIKLPDELLLPQESANTASLIADDA